MNKYYDRHGTPMEMLEWARAFENPEVQRVAEDSVGQARVSTVWLGLDHGYGDGPPIIFETMVFGGPLDEEQARYSTEEEALKGHAVMLQRVKEAK